MNTTLPNWFPDYKNRRIKPSIAAPDTTDPDICFHQSRRLIYEHAGMCISLMGALSFFQALANYSARRRFFRDARWRRRSQVKRQFAGQSNHLYIHFQIHF